MYVFEDLEQYVMTNPANGHQMLVPSEACMAAIKEMSCGHGVAIVSGKEIYVGELTLYANKKWSQLKAESVYVPAVESYAPLSTFIINACDKMGCNSSVDKFKIKLNSLNGIAGAIKNP